MLRAVQKDEKKKKEEKYDVEIRKVMLGDGQKAKR